MVLSIVVPVYNELEALPALLSTLRKVLANLHSYEVIFVDDGSRDGSSDALRHAANTDPCLKVLFFSRNFGHQAAITASAARFQHLASRQIWSQTSGLPL